MEYKKDGFNPSVVKDKLFYLHPKSGEYEVLDEKAFNDIVTGKIRIWNKWCAAGHIGLFQNDVCSIICDHISSRYFVGH